MRSVLHRLGYQFSGTIWAGIGGAALLEEVWHCFESILSCPTSNLFSASYLQLRM